MPPVAARSALARSSALARAWPWPSTIASSSLSPSALGPQRCSFSRGRSCGATVFIVHHTCYTARVMRRLYLLLGTCVLFAACSEPPQKEIDRAQGALDAARAAGADEYAADPFNAATTALRQSREAVEQRDYRLALSRALDASERAQEAAKQAADGKVRARAESEKAVNATTAALQQLENRVKAAGVARVAAQELASAARAVRDTGAVLQKARAELRAGNYLAVSKALQEPQARIAAEIRRVDDLVAGRAARRKK